MKIAFYFGHPAQFLFVRQTIKELKQQNHEVLILLKKKDVLETLVQASGFEFTNILPKERKNSRLATMTSLLKRNRLMYPILKLFQPDLLISSDASFAQLGKIINIPRITILEDDYEVIKPLAQITYPFTSTILCPNVCSVGKWTSKKFGYDGYMKLGYLHPDVFTPNISNVEKYNIDKDYAIIRLAKLSAYHDEGVKGISHSLLDRIIKTLEKKNIIPLISAEGSIPKKYAERVLKIDPVDMHHILAHAKILICDSQSMSVEAAVLGVPSLRYSSFAGRISVLEELESKYKLTFGFQIGQQIELFNKLENILEMHNFSSVFKLRQLKMLEHKINVTEFLVRFFTNYTLNMMELSVDSISNIEPSVAENKDVA
ncbi:MAG: DUF354 domain-containing protein [Crocinitomicaceae bacterium]|nr:DUF354 domain-containing protein [Crocinitomicaceae bacterium]